MRSVQAVAQHRCRVAAHSTIARIRARTRPWHASRTSSPFDVREFSRRLNFRRVAHNRSGIKHMLVYARLTCFPADSHLYMQRLSAAGEPAFIHRPAAQPFAVAQPTPGKTHPFGRRIPGNPHLSSSPPAASSNLISMANQSNRRVSRVQCNSGMADERRLTARRPDASPCRRPC